MRTLSPKQPRNLSLLSHQRKLIPLSLVIIFVVLQIWNVNKEVSSLNNGNSFVVKKSGFHTATRTSASSAHLYSLQADSMVEDNNTHPMYTWIGNFPVPPMGIPYLLPQQIRGIFHSENTLWLGDSTARQDYQTMYLLIHSDSATRDHLNMNINKGKRGPAPRHCPARRQSEEIFSDLGQVKGTDQNCSTNAAVMSNETNTYKSWSNVAGKFDLGPRLGCVDQLTDILKNHTELIKREYSILVISSGIWESFRPHVCKRANETDKGIASHALDLLDFLFQEVAGPSVFVIWKTHGPLKDDQRTANMEQIDELLVTAARSWFAEKQPPYMDLADFNLEIDERAHGRDRIEGDLRPHWGLEGRLLSIQMVSDSVRRKQEREIA